MIIVLVAVIFWLLVIITMKNKTIRDLQYELEESESENINLKTNKL